MNFSKSNRARWLDIGLAVFTLGIVTGIATLVYGQTGYFLQRRVKEAEGPAAPGTIPAERHENISTASAR